MSVCGFNVRACLRACVRLGTRLGISDRDIIAEQGERYTALIHRGRAVFSLTLREVSCSFPDFRRDAGMQARSSSPRGSDGHLVLGPQFDKQPCFCPLQ